jgi:hypothetical protein
MFKKPDGTDFTEDEMFAITGTINGVPYKIAQTREQ